MKKAGTPPLRQLSIDNGDGTCKWQPPAYSVPEDIEFHKTIITGFPSGDKRLTFVQLEALTGWSAKDEWDFQFLGMSNHPFIKANYPHHEGIWGWDDAGDQVVMVVRNMRRSMVEYHDILWDIGYAKTWAEAFELIPNLYSARPPLDDFLAWRDLRVMDEIHWYGWFIDYWMEGGLLRDIFTHKITTNYHWNLLMMPTVYSKSEVAYDLIIGNQTVSPEFDPNCANKVSGGCQPIQIISAEKLVELETGPDENAKIAQTIAGKAGIGEYLIDQSVWSCIWEELIVNKKGLKTFIDREGVSERDYKFSAEMLGEMIHELDRMIDKYGSNESPDFWYAKQTAKDLVSLFTEHRSLIQEELDDVLATGGRKLTEHDFLGPNERQKMKKTRQMDILSNILKEKGQEAHKRALADIASEEKRDHTDFFNDLDNKLLEHRTNDHKKKVFEEANNREQADEESK